MGDIQIRESAAGIVAGVDRHPLAALLAVSVVLIATAVVRAGAKPFAHDEIITLVVSGLPTIRRVWSAQAAGADLAPPLNSIATHLATHVFGSSRLTARLPALTGYWAMTVMLFEIVRRRSNAVVGLSAALLPNFTGAAAYAYEARGYGLMLGLFALALFAWSEAAKGRARWAYLPLLALALASGIWAHYYAVLAVVPIAVGEGVRVARTRRVDWGIVAAVAAAGIATLPLASQSLAASSRAAGYWAHPNGIVEDLIDACRFVAGPLLGRRALLLFAFVAFVALAARFERVSRGWMARAVPGHEIAAGLATLLIPLWGVLLGIWVTDVFLPRYVLLGVVGLAIVGPLLVWWASPTRIADVALCLGLAAAFAYSAAGTLFWARPRFENPVDHRPLLTEKLAGTTPVAVTDTLFLEAWYYTPPNLQRQLTYIADPATSLRLSGSDSADRNYLPLRSLSHMNVEDWSAFAAAHHTFSVYTAGSHHWQLTNLRERGATLHEIGHELGYWLYDVEMPGTGS